MRLLGLLMVWTCYSVGLIGAMGTGFVLYDAPYTTRLGAALPFILIGFAGYFLQRRLPPPRGRPR